MTQIMNELREDIYRRIYIRNMLILITLKKQHNHLSIQC
jgi:hypothetical protein